VNIALVETPLWENELCVRDLFLATTERSLAVQLWHKMKREWKSSPTIAYKALGDGIINFRGLSKTAKRTRNALKALSRGWIQWEQLPSTQKCEVDYIIGCSMDLFEEAMPLVKDERRLFELVMENMNESSIPDSYCHHQLDCVLSCESSLLRLIAMKSNWMAVVPMPMRTREFVAKALKQNPRIIPIVSLLFDQNFHDMLFEEDALRAYINATDDYTDDDILDHLVPGHLWDSAEFCFSWIRASGHPRESMIAVLLDSEDFFLLYGRQHPDRNVLTRFMHLSPRLSASNSFVERLVQEIHIGNIMFHIDEEVRRNVFLLYEAFTYSTDLDEHFHVPHHLEDNLETRLDALAFRLFYVA